MHGWGGHGDGWTRPRELVVCVPGITQGVCDGSKGMRCPGTAGPLYSDRGLATLLCNREAVFNWPEPSHPWGGMYPNYNYY